MSSAQNSRGSVAAFGFRVKSGWASAILLNGPLKAPVVLSRWNVLMSDPKIPETKQPYHASTGVLEERSTIISKRVRIIRNATRASVRALLRESRNAGLKIRIAGLVVGSTIEPQSIGNPHIRAHAFEGQLFRTVLSEALKTHGIPVSVFVERDVFARGRPQRVAVFRLAGQFERVALQELMITAGRRVGDVETHPRIKVPRESNLPAIG